MNQKIKTTCFILIALAILLGVGFYGWNIWQKQQIATSGKQFQKIDAECIKYVLYDPDKKAYRWKKEFVEEYFKTYEEALQNCRNTYQEMGWGNGY